MKGPSAQIKPQQKSSRLVGVEFDGGRGKETRRREAGSRQAIMDTPHRHLQTRTPSSSDCTAGVGPRLWHSRPISLAPPPMWFVIILAASPSAQPCAHPPYPERLRLRIPLAFPNSLTYKLYFTWFPSLVTVIRP